MPSMLWRVLGLDLNRSESTGTLARAIPWGRLNVVEKKKLRLDVPVGDGTSGKVQLFSRINPGPIKAWRLRLSHLLPRRRGGAGFDSRRSPRREGGTAHLRAVFRPASCARRTPRAHPV